VYGFLKQSHGHAKLASEAGRGTVVSIYLPRFAGTYKEEPNASQGAEPRKTGNETILIVEDDAEVRAFSVEVLRDLGYQTLEAADGSSALDVLDRHKDTVDLLFSDVVLPGGINGAVLATRALTLSPRLKVLYTTGYARDAIVHGGRLDAGVELIRKPFTYDDLASRVRETLDKVRSG
jgi:CheY-like chemotaxis protein